MDFFWVAGPKILAGGLQFLLMLALLRYFDPEHYGLISVCLSGVLLSDSILGGATDSGVLRLASSSSAGSLLRSLQFQQAGLVLKLAGVLLVAIPAFFLARRISLLLFQTGEDVRYLGMSCLALIGMLVLRSVQMHYQVSGRFLAYGASDLGSSVLKFGGIGILLLLSRPSPGWVLALYAIGPLAIAAWILTSSGRSLISTPFSGGAFRELISHVKWFLAVSATGTLMARMDVFILSSMDGVGSAGVYSAAQMIVLIPQLMGSYIAVVFSPRIMPMWESGTLRKLYQNFQLGIISVAVIAFLAAVVLMPQVSDILFPKAFHRSGPVILALLPSGLCALVNFPLTILLLLFLKPRLLVALDCIFLPILLFAYGWAIRSYGVIGAASITSAAALIKTAIMQTVAWRMLRGQDAVMSAVSISSFQTLEEGPNV